MNILKFRLTPHIFFFASALHVLLVLVSNSYRLSIAFFLHALFYHHNVFEK